MNISHFSLSVSLSLSLPVDYKGHVLLQCLENCSIHYHTSCWRRFKTEGVTGADKDHLGSDCPTPDCLGTIKTVTVYDNRGKIKIKVSVEGCKGSNTFPKIITKVILLHDTFCP